MVNGSPLEVHDRVSIDLQFVPNEGGPVSFTIHEALPVLELAYYLFELRAAAKR